MMDAADNEAVTSRPNQPENAASHARRWAGQWALSAAQTMHDLTARKYTLPDKNVASQLLMYRQLLHTKCRPNLKLSRDYQGTPAQVAVKHMPWWSEGCEETRKMVISYDNLIRRLWLHGAIIPYHDNDDQHQDTLLNEEGMPPVPHDYWVHRLGFQQNDPVTDFRSGGVLSLAMMVFMVESSPHIFRRFMRQGDASVLPFGITSINVTDMISKFLMLAKSVDRMDALLSQKPFWRMFADPNALLACQELSMDMLADVVVELQTERSCEDDDNNDTAKVTVFDFSYILEKSERRVQYDLLGAGPKNVQDLRNIHARLKTKYRAQLQQRVQQIRNNKNTLDQAFVTNNTTTPADKVRDQVLHHASGLAAGATHLAGSVAQRMSLTGLLPRRSSSFAPTTTTTTTEATTTITNNDKGNSENIEEDTDGDWMGTDILAATDAVSHFSIGDEDDDHL